MNNTLIISDKNYVTLALATLGSKTVVRFYFSQSLQIFFA